MIGLLEGVKDKLVAANVGVWQVAGVWKINIGSLTKDEGNSIAVILGPSLPPNPKYLLDYPSVQVLVRGQVNTYKDTLIKAQEIKDVLLGLPSQNVGTDRWVIITCIGDINTLGKDERDRPVFSINFQFTIEPAASAKTNRIPL